MKALCFSALLGLGAVSTHPGCAAVPVELQTTFPGWALVESKHFTNHLNANIPSAKSPGLVEQGNTLYALLFKEVGNRRCFKLVFRAARDKPWNVIHDEENDPGTAFCWIEPVTGTVVKDAQGKQHRITPGLAILFSFDRGYECVFTLTGGRWKRIVTFTEC